MPINWVDMLHRISVVALWAMLGWLFATAEVRHTDNDDACRCYSLLHDCECSECECSEPNHRKTD